MTFSCVMFATELSLFHAGTFDAVNTAVICTDKCCENTGI